MGNFSFVREGGFVVVGVREKGVGNGLKALGDFGKSNSAQINFLLSRFLKIIVGKLIIKIDVIVDVIVEIGFRFIHKVVLCHGILQSSNQSLLGL